MTGFALWVFEEAGFLDTSTRDVARTVFCLVNRNGQNSSNSKKPDTGLGGMYDSAVVNAAILPITTN